MKKSLEFHKNRVNNAFRESDLMAMSRHLHMYEEEIIKEQKYKKQNKKENENNHLQKNPNLNQIKEIKTNKKNVLQSQRNNNVYRVSPLNSPYTAEKNIKNYRKSFNKMKKMESKLKNLNLSDSSQSKFTKNRLYPFPNK